MYSMISLADCSAGEIHASHDFLGKAKTVGRLELDSGPGTRCGSPRRNRHINAARFQT